MTLLSKIHLLSFLQLSVTGLLVLCFVRRGNRIGYLVSSICEFLSRFLAAACRTDYTLCTILWFNHVVLENESQSRVHTAMKFAYLQIGAKQTARLLL